jgi:DUF2934 family protein
VYKHGGIVMATKLDSTGKKALKRKVAAAAPELTVMSDLSVRRQLVAVEAYLLAERRGFAAGRELEDWVAAEALVDSRFG